MLFMFVGGGRGVANKILGHFQIKLFSNEKKKNLPTNKKLWVVIEEKDRHFCGNLLSISWANGDKVISTAPRRIPVDCPAVPSHWVRFRLYE